MRLFKPDVEKMEKNKDINGLTKALKDQDEHVRWKAAGALGNMGDTRAVEPLIQTLKDDVDVRWAAALALGKIGDAKAVEPLIQALKDESSSVREIAAGALGNIGDVRAVEPLIQTLKDDVHDVRHVAAEALVKIGKPAAEPLSKTLKYEDRVRGSEVRRITAMVLGKIGDARAVEWLTSTANDPKEEPIVRWEAKEALKKIKEKKN